jgi:hypothetical protein
MAINPKNIGLAKYQLIIFIFACLTLVAAFSGYIATGSFMRLSGDDYCFGAVETEHGFWQGLVHAYLRETAFDGDRFSLDITSLFSSWVGPLASAILPGLVLLLWMAGTYLAVRGLFDLLGRNTEKSGSFHTFQILLISGLVIFFSLYLAPNLGQSLYWRSGLLTYLMPMTVFTYSIAFFINSIGVYRVRWLRWTTLFVLALFAAGFSEAVAALELGFYGLVLVSALILLKWRGDNSRRVLKPLSALLCGTILAMVIMLLCPANAPRQIGLPHPPGIGQLIYMSLQNGVVFYNISLYNHLLPYILCGLIFVAISCLYYMRQPAKDGQRSNTFIIKRFTILFSYTLIAGYLIVVNFMAPIAYAESSYPDLRSLITPGWVMVIQIGILGWLTGWMLSQWIKPRPRTAQWVSTLAMIAILAAGGLPLATTMNIYLELPRYERWAVFWNTRDTEIRLAKQENQTTIRVMEIDHIIQGVSELQPDPFFWYNVCAARYYGLQRIYANLPGWDP